MDEFERLKQIGQLIDGADQCERERIVAWMRSKYVVRGNVDVDEIVHRSANGQKQADIAAAMGLSQPTVSRVLGVLRGKKEPEAALPRPLAARDAV